MVYIWFVGDVLESFMFSREGVFHWKCFFFLPFFLFCRGVLRCDEITAFSADDAVCTGYIYIYSYIEYYHIIITDIIVSYIGIFMYLNILRIYQINCNSNLSVRFFIFIFIFISIFSNQKKKTNYI